MTPGLIHALLPGRLVVLGAGSVAQATLPLILRHIEIEPQKITIISPSDSCRRLARKHGARHQVLALSSEGDLDRLQPLLGSGDLLLNLSVDVASLALIQWCHAHGVLYLDASTEPWPGRYQDDSLSLSQRSNYALREEILAFRQAHPTGPTALITQGANPGLVNAFVKQALLNMARDSGWDVAVPASPEAWAGLAQRLGIKVIHIAERDSQVSRTRKRDNEFVNTWSVKGLVSEAWQPAEMGWGTHEQNLPPEGRRHQHGCDAAIYLNRPGANTMVYSWTPLQGEQLGFLITHAESISIADHLTLRSGTAVIYRPTVYYAYRPCDDTVLSLYEMAGRHGRMQDALRIIRDDIDDGSDELGVLLLGHPKGAYWYGSRLSVSLARELAPANSATSLQVAAGVLAGMVCILRHPQQGVIEPDDLDHDVVIDLAHAYLGELVGVWSNWDPLKGRAHLFEEDLDVLDPWQFKNFRLN